MKKGERFKLESAWWEKNKAKTLKSDLGLGATLKKYEAAAGALKAEPSEARYKLALKLAGEVGSTATALAGKCVEAVHAETKAALLTAPAVVAHDTAPISKAASEYQQKLAKARKRYLPMGPKVEDLKGKVDQLTALTHSLDKAIKSGNRMVAMKKYNEFSTIFRGMAGAAEEPGALLKDEKDALNWCRELSSEDGDEIQAVIANLSQFATVWQRESRHWTTLIFDAKAIVSKMPAN